MLEIGKGTIPLRNPLREKDQADNQWRCYEGVLDTLKMKSIKYSYYFLYHMWLNKNFTRIVDRLTILK